MDDKKWKEFIQREMDKEMEEIEGVLEKINNDPVMREWKAPEGLRDGLFEQIHAKEAEKSRLSDDEKQRMKELFSLSTNIHTWLVHQKVLHLLCSF